MTRPDDNLSLATDAAFADLVQRSYRKWTGLDLTTGVIAPGGAAGWLYEQAPFCLLAHDLSPVPRFIYANRAAQRCFEYSWDELVGMPSSHSARPQDRADRQRFIETVRRDGWATGYRGVRVAKSGRLFWIDDVTMWQVTDPAGQLLCEAAVYRTWRDA